MSVYVDDMEAPFGRMVMCHMIADTRAELLAMASEIGVQPKWIQKRDTYAEHFDICLAMKAKAISAGAIQVTSKQLVLRMMNKRLTGVRG